MREWVAALEEVIDNKLKLWAKGNKIENGEAVELYYRFEQNTMGVFVFWHDNEEMVTLKCMGPRVTHSYHWNNLNNRTFNKVMDRVGNLAQMIMHPPIDPTD